MAKQNEIKFLTTQRVEKRQKKYCRFKKMGIRYIDYKDGEFLKKFLNEQGKMLPRRISGNSLNTLKSEFDSEWSEHTSELNSSHRTTQGILPFLPLADF